MSFTEWKTIEGLTVTEANDGINVISMKGPGGMGPTAFVIIANATYPEGFPASIQLFPGERFTNDDLGNGVIGVTTTYVNTGDDETYGMSWDGNTFIAGGLWSGDIRVAFAGPEEALIDITLQFSSLDPQDPLDFPNPLDEPIREPEITDPTFDEELNEGRLTFTFQYDNTLVENPDGFVIRRNHLTGSSGGGAGQGGIDIGDPPAEMYVASIPWIDGTVEYTFEDYVYDFGEYEYWIYVYKYPNFISPPSDPINVVFDADVPDIIITGSGGVDFGGASTIVYIEDPSGIYTLVNHKTNDTLYNRIDVDPIDVKIPDPFIKTGYIGG